MEGSSSRLGMCMVEHEHEHEHEHFEYKQRRCIYHIPRDPPRRSHQKQSHSTNP